ncbi:hypothetical protein T265_11209 [Opisthorchis viverrini]|uniref:Uncharacterized protein n=1 Tax=Opisthorchis viverrini TaxID=6198 RepID=A0A074YZK6_OPIVI|nr:hypothetical protein T265_11209 [Opisthorchis viverrini]KER20191.1 hypothetical protein T265_11209 [Opisthorchis viverrini]
MVAYFRDCPRVSSLMHKETWRTADGSCQEYRPSDSRAPESTSDWAVDRGRDGEVASLFPDCPRVSSLMHKETWRTADGSCQEYRPSDSRAPESTSDWAVDRGRDGEVAIETK